MKILGFDLSKNEIRYTLIDGNKLSPILVEKDRLVVLTTPNVSELMNWFETKFESLITRMKPDKVAYRLSLNPLKEQMFYLTYPYAILEILCYKHKISISSHTKGNFAATKFGLTKGSDVYKYCDDVFGINKPYWDEKQKHSLLSAWLNIE
ncbi:MAG: hypothetical protein A2Y10_11375 [Planctomycetes bacterium GWF2_41_51]|nr:MAG: hypothetical protein A2Y10_11375 [Planctomycetes bacterium GWF2_41_51]HBG26360.1 hypothetical protein [Phycisphaerales bacterium]